MSKKKELPTVTETADKNPERCGTCRFWFNEEIDQFIEDHEFFDPGSLGECRRYPPAVTGSQTFRKAGDVFEHSCNPATLDSQWCGEWQAMRGAVAPKVELAPPDRSNLDVLRGKIIELLLVAGSSGATLKQIKSSLGKRGNKHHDGAEHALRKMVGDGEVERFAGLGRSNSPFLYRIPVKDAD